MVRLGGLLLSQVPLLQRFRSDSFKPGIQISQLLPQILDDLHHTPSTKAGSINFSAGSLWHLLPNSVEFGIIAEREVYVVSK